MKKFDLAVGEVGVIDDMNVRCVDKHAFRGSYICPACCFDKKGVEFCNKISCGPDERADGHYAIYQEVK